MLPASSVRRCRNGVALAVAPAAVEVGVLGAVDAVGEAETIGAVGAGSPRHGDRLVELVFPAAARDLLRCSNDLANLRGAHAEDQPLMVQRVTLVASGAVCVSPRSSVSDA